MLHFHILLASLFVLSFFTKAILLISGNLEKLAIYKKKTFIVEMIIELLVVRNWRPSDLVVWLPLLG